jgi:hypothetical protein
MQKLIVAICGLAEDGDNNALLVAVVAADNPVTNIERYGGHGGSISPGSAPIPKLARDAIVPSTEPYYLPPA